MNPLGNGTSQAGFGLIEVIISVALLGVMGLAFTSLVTNMHTEMSRVSAKAETTSLLSEVQGSLLTALACERMFNLSTANGPLLNLTNAGPGGPGQNLDMTLSNGERVGSPAGSSSATANVAYPKLLIENVMITNARLIQNDPPQSVYSANLVLHVTERGGSGTTFRPLQAGQVNFRVDTASNRILSCFSGGGNSNTTTQAMCENLGGTWTNSQCQMGPTTAQLCQQIGGSWVNSQCQMGRGICQQMGGTWANSQCDMGPTPSELCQQVGGTWNNSQCQVGPTVSDLCSAMGGSFSRGRCTMPAPSYQVDRGTCRTIRTGGAGDNGCDCGLNSVMVTNITNPGSSGSAHCVCCSLEIRPSR